MTPAQLKKRREALMREQAEWQRLLTDAKARCDAMTDLDALAEELRSYLLAKADLHSFNWGADPVKGLPVTAMWRRRANDDGYRMMMACQQMVARMMADADKRTGLKPEERKAMDDQRAAEDAAFMRSLRLFISEAK